MSEYEAVKVVLKERIDALRFDIRNLRDERKDIAADPEMGRTCPEYRDVERELAAARHKLCEVKELLEHLDSDVEEVLFLSYES